jgi:hypothetical protein
LGCILGSDKHEACWHVVARPRQLCKQGTKRRTQLLLQLKVAPDRNQSGCQLLLWALRKKQQDVNLGKWQQYVNSICGWTANTMTVVWVCQPTS